MKLNPLRWPLATRIIGGLVVGAAAGLVTELAVGPSPDVRWVVQNVTQPVGSVFLRIIFMVVIPLIFAAIVLGVAEMGDIRKLGKAGGRCLLVTVVFATHQRRHRHRPGRRAGAGAAPAARQARRAGRAIRRRRGQGRRAGAAEDRPDRRAAEPDPDQPAQRGGQRLQPEAHGRRAARVHDLQPVRRHRGGVAARRSCRRQLDRPVSIAVRGRDEDHRLRDAAGAARRRVPRAFR